MKKIEYIHQILFGDSSHFSSERYFVIVTSLVASIFSLALSIYHIIMGITWAPIWIAAASASVLLVLYYLARYKNWLLLPKLLLTTLGLVLLDLTWYTKYLSNGPLLYFVLIFVALIVWIWKGKQLLFAMVFYFVNLGLLFYIDYNAPRSLLEYPNAETRSIDIFISFFIYSLLLVVLLYVIKRQFLNEQQKVTHANELYLSLFNNSSIGLYQTTPGGKVLSANPFLVNMLGYASLEELLTRDLAKESYVDSNKRDEFRRIMEEKDEVVGFESQWYAKDKRIITVIEAAKAVRDENGKIVRYDGTIEDVTEKKKNRKALVEALDKANESERLKSAFLANMSHEIRTPMNGILGFMDLLKQPSLDAKTQQEYISVVEKSGNRLLNIINDIISVSRIEAGQVELVISPSDVREQVEYIHNFFQPEIKQKGMKFKLKNLLSEGDEMIQTDREKLFAILTNLIKNAIKFTDSGYIELGFAKKGNFIQFYVKDTGIGIEKDRQHAIFARFVQADIEDKNAFQGAGLGLAISKAFVEMLGGSIWVESKKGKGTTFFFTIAVNKPSTKKSKAPKDEQLEESKPALKNLKVLIAEDDETSRMLISIMMKEYCREIIRVSTGHEVIEYCRKNTDLDLILLDMRMPGMSGYEAAQQIREFNNKVLIVAQTAFSLKGDREKAIVAGCDDYITKPIAKEKLAELIRKYI